MCKLFVSFERKLTTFNVQENYLKILELMKTEGISKSDIVNRILNYALIENPELLVQIIKVLQIDIKNKI